MKPKCPACGSINGVTRSKADANINRHDPVCDLITCVNCGVILGVLPSYEDQWDLRVLLDREIPINERCPVPN